MFYLNDMTVINILQAVDRSVFFRSVLSSSHKSLYTPTV